MVDPAEARPRMLAASTARLLQAAVRSVGAVGLGCAAAALLVLLLNGSAVGKAAAMCAWAVLVLGMAERVLAFRLQLDAGLFTDLAAAPGDAAGALAALDQALQDLGLRQRAASTRPLIDRVHGTQRLMRLHLLCVLAQSAALTAALLLRGS